MYRTPERGPESSRPKYYVLDFFPYPSGNGLSVGHGRNYVPTDVVARHRRMAGYDVLHPMGWDAFGLPAENEAIKRGTPPWQTTARNTANYRRQMTLTGCSYDWEREINSSQPDFYRWTQWFFLLLYRRGLAYRAVAPQWWCPGCKTVLANEQVTADGSCWRGHPGVYKRAMEQWYFKITAYTEELLSSLQELDWPAHVLEMQRQWIGRSEGVEFEMPVEGTGEKFSVYTTRPDTICGVTFAVLAPEHPLVDRITSAAQRPLIDAYRRAVAHRSDVDRIAGRARDGVFTGAFAVHPVNARRIPVYIADYALITHGTGAIMGVPAHDERDYEFAQRHGLPSVRVIEGDREAGQGAWTGPGRMINSGAWNGMPSAEAGERIADWLAERGSGRRRVQYRLRDWLISRQRYWGAPIPIVYCDRCGIVPVPEEQLPVPLPPVDAWTPGKGGRSPLANVDAFVNTACPRCGGPGRRETDTMDGFACSSWYFLRFTSPQYNGGPFDPASLAAWGYPDLYVGGAEHAVMHLLYARFWTKVMADAGLVSFREPFPKLRSQGVMHAADPKSGEIRRMAKSAGNVVTPDSVAEEHGADAMRLYLLFMAPFENHTVWDGAGITGPRRFLERAWRLAHEVAQAQPWMEAQGDNSELSEIVAATVRRVTSDIEDMAFNTAIAALMECLNALIAHREARGITPDVAPAVRTFVLLLAPFAPFIAEELWERLGGAYSVHQQAWPAVETASTGPRKAIIVVQVNGRVRDRLDLSAGAAESDVRAAAMDSPSVRRALDGRTPVRTVFVPGRLMNIVTG